jgi:hypothetical protein
MDEIMETKGNEWVSVLGDRINRSGLYWHTQTHNTHTHTHTHTNPHNVWDSIRALLTRTQHRLHTKAEQGQRGSGVAVSALLQDCRSTRASLPMKEVKVSEHIPLGLHTDGVQWKVVLPIVLYGSGSSTPSGSSHQPPSPSSILPRPFLGMVVLGEF